MSLSDWGEIPHRNLELAEGEALARIIEEQKTSFQVATEKGFLKAQVAGKLLRPSVDRLLRPVVGDWVKIRALWQEKKAVIQEVLPRSSLLRRKAAGESEAVQPLAANVSLTLIVTTLNREFNEKRLHRYLTAAEESGSRVAVLFTKSDLIPESFACAEEIGRAHV